MTFFKTFQTNNRQIPISKEEARGMIAETYGENNADRHMETLLRERTFGLGYWILTYEPTLETYCKDQGCESDYATCGYYPVACKVLKYGRQG